jgi:hypothetical protein
MAGEHITASRGAHTGTPQPLSASLAHILSGLSGFRGREVSSGSPPGTAW